VILDLIANTKINSCERKFAYELYKGSGLQRFQSKKIKEMLKEQEETTKDKGEEFKLSQDYRQLKESFEKNAPKLSGFKN